MPAAVRPRASSSAAAALVLLALLPAAAGAGLVRRRQPARFTVDLGLPPERRWEEVVLAYRDLLPPLLLQVEAALGEADLKKPPPPAASKEEAESDDPSGLERIREEEAEVEAEESAKENRSEARRRAWWQRGHRLAAEELAELAGIAKLADHEEVTLDRLIAWQMTQDLLQKPFHQFAGRRFQSGIALGLLLADANGTVTMQQNLDFNFYFVAGGRRTSLQDIVLELTFVRDGAPLFVGVGFPGRIGAITGMALSDDPAKRWSVYGGNIEQAAAVDQLFGNGSRPLELDVRGLLAAGLDYGAACRRLRELPGDHLFHVAGGGSWEGAIISTNFWRKGRDTVIAALSPAIGRWFVASTDKRKWFNVGAFREDDAVMEADVLLQDLGQERAAAGGLLPVLRGRHALTSATVLTWLSVPARGFQRAYLAKEPTGELVVDSGL